MTEEVDNKRLQTIGAHIKALRLKAGYTSYETFATDHGFPRKNYWRIETGHNFTMDTLLRILEIHNMTLAEFFKDLE